MRTSSLPCLVLLFFRTASFAAETDAPSKEPVEILLEAGAVAAGDSGAWMLQRIKEFESINPNVKVRYFSLKTPNRLKKRIEDLPELGLNIVGIRSNMGYEVSYLAERDLIVPVERFLPDEGFITEDFFENSWDAVTYRGNRWGVPFRCTPIVFVLDWPLFEKAGIDRPPKDWDEVVEYSRKLTRDTVGDGEPDQWGFRLGWRGKEDNVMFYLWLTMVLQKGGFIMRDGRFDLSHPSLRESYDFLLDLEKCGGAVHDPRSFHLISGDTRVRYAMQIAPSYRLMPLRDNHDFRVAPWPTFGREAIADELRVYLAIGKSSPEKEAASWELVKWITRESAPFPEDLRLFHLSCRRDLLDHEDVRKITEPWAKGFDAVHSTKNWCVDLGEQVTGRYEAVKHLESIVLALFRGEIGFDAAMAKAENECNATLQLRTDAPEPYALYEPSPAETGALLDLRETLAKWDHAIRGFPHHPGTDKAMESVFHAIAGGGASSRDPAEVLIQRFPDSAIGLQSFDMQCASLPGENERRKYCRKVESSYPGTAVSAFAFDKTFQRRIRGENRAELAETDQWEGNARLKEIVLLRKAEMLRDRHEFQGAAVEYLRFWSLAPEKVERMQLDRTISSCLKNAGMFLEAISLSAAENGGVVARCFLNDFAAPPPLTEVYLRGPLRVEPTILGEGEGGRTVERALFLARAGCLEFWRMRNAKASSLFDEYRLAAEAALANATLDPARLATLAAAHPGVTERVVCLAAGKNPAFKSALFKPGTPDVDRTAKRMSSLGSDLAFAAAKGDREWLPLAENAVHARVRLLDAMKDAKGVVQTYEGFVSAFPDAPSAPAFLLVLAQEYRDGLRDLDRALGVCEDLARCHPESREAAEASVMRYDWLYRAGRYAEALEVADELAGSATGEKAVYAEFTAALCKSGMGDEADCESRLKRLVADHRGHALAQKALLWMAAIRVSDLDYSEARRILTQLVDAPTRGASRAGTHSILERLSSPVTGAANSDSKN